MARRQVLHHIQHRGVKPEEKARQVIDAQLVASGWVVQDREEFNRKAALGMAVREFQLSTGPCDYLLLVDGKACGVIEAKPASVTLSLSNDHKVSVSERGLCACSDQGDFDGGARIGAVSVIVESACGGIVE